MILLRQLWNQRRHNVWIFLELLVAGFFLWMVIDPIYVLVSNRLIPQGGDNRGVYVLTLGQYDPSFAQYDPRQDSAHVMYAHYEDIVRRVRTCPEVEAYTIAAYGSYPNARSWSGMELYNADSLRVHAQQYRYVPLPESDMARAYGLQDALTGRPLSLPADFAQRNMIAISAQTALRLFGTVQAAGRTVYETPDRQYPHVVAAVFRPYKHYSSEQPYPLAITAEAQIPMMPYTGLMYPIVFRLKEGVDPEAFLARFAAEVQPGLEQGNFYVDTLQSFSDYGDRMALASGVTNKLRLQYALGGFALLCIFLGMVGTFYIRANARREEIGILRAMGAGRGRVARRFLTEAWVMVTVAYALSLLVVANVVHVSGFAQGVNSLTWLGEGVAPDMSYPQNRLWPHFLVVTLLTYAALWLVALLGTWIPVSRAVRVLPADALRDE